jgi:hypothetical protein
MVAARYKADHEFADLTAAGALGGASGLLGLRDQQQRIVSERLTSGREFHVAPIASQQLDVQVPFQPADLLAERWLADPQPRSGATEMQFLSEHQEVLDVT